MTAERMALEILLRVTQEGAYANLALKDGLASCGNENSARVTALVYTTLEHMGYADHIISHYAKGRLHGKIRAILRMAVTELFYMDAPDYAVCSRAAELASSVGKHYLKGYVNGVLRSIARDRACGRLPQLPSDPVLRLEIESGYPAFMISEYAESFGMEETAKMLLYKPEVRAVRPVSPFTAEALIDHFTAEGVRCEKSRVVPGAVKLFGFGGNIADDPLFQNGSFAVQSESAMLACICLDPSPGDIVLDACAAPGGKTAYIAELMGTGEGVTAWELHPHRAELIEKTLSRLHVEGVKTEIRDASRPDPSLDGSFDRILLDVPCSGLVGGSKPEARYRRTEESIEELSRLQSEILASCSKMLRRGGSLVYSTCTVSRRENERVIERFIAENEDFSLVPIDRYLPESFGGRGRSGMLQLLPHIDDTEGFFIAKLVRRN